MAARLPGAERSGAGGGPSRPRRGDPGASSPDLPPASGRSARADLCGGRRSGENTGASSSARGGGGGGRSILETGRPGTKAPRQPRRFYLPPAEMASLGLGGLNVSARRKSVPSRNAAVERRNLITVCR